MTRNCYQTAKVAFLTACTTVNNSIRDALRSELEKAHNLYLLSLPYSTVHPP